MRDLAKEQGASICAELWDAGVEAVADAPFGALSTYRVGGRAAALVTIQSSSDIDILASLLVAYGSPKLMVIGGGSNLLVADEGFSGVVLRLGSSMAYEVFEGESVRIGGASLLPSASRRIAAAGLTGFEWAVGVPGSMGGAVRMNAGGHGSDVAANLVSASVADLAQERPAPVSVAAGDLKLGYRSSAIQAAQVVMEAVLRLEEGSAEDSKARISEIVAWRRQHQPGGQNAGSVFANPPGDHAARLIEACGFKGKRHGSAQVSPKHANFIQCDANGSANDVAELMALVRDGVLGSTGVALHTEIRLVGFGDSFGLGTEG